MKVRSDWLTSIRVQRLGQILIGVPSISRYVTQKELENILWRNCGGPMNEVRNLIDILAGLKLIRRDNQSVIRTKTGDSIAKALRAGDAASLALSLIRVGYFHDQARILIECGRVNDFGNLRCSTRLARTGAAQLVGLLQSWNGIQLLPELLIPARVFEELNAVWALLPPPVELPKWAAERKAVGDRAEMYTVQYERGRVGTNAIFWVSRDSDALGWDVEDRSTVPRRCIEVKGRREVGVVFYLSENEWNKAQELGRSYEIQFWGGIDLSKEPSFEYAFLRGEGFPIRISNVAEELRNNWLAVPVTWKISRREPAL
jgi:hypothetical protein